MVGPDGTKRRKGKRSSIISHMPVRLDLKTDCTRPGQGLYRLPLQSAGYCDTPLVLWLPLSIPFFFDHAPFRTLLSPLFTPLYFCSSLFFAAPYEFFFRYPSFSLLLSSPGYERSVHTGPHFATRRPAPFSPGPGDFASTRTLFTVSFPNVFRHPPCLETRLTSVLNL